MTSWLTSSELRDLAERRWGHSSLWRCVYCGRSTPDGAVDHFIPRRRGGTDLPWNLVPACPRCNRAKSDHDPLRWMDTVGVPASTASAIHEITQSPAWTRDNWRHSRLAVLDYPAADAMPEANPLSPLPLNVAEVFVLDPTAWAPAVALRRIAADYLAEQGRPPLSSQQLTRDLTARGFVKTKRKGIYGYRGIYVTPDAAEAGRFAAGPAATAAARRQGRTRTNHNVEADWAYRAGFWRAGDSD